MIRSNVFGLDIGTSKMKAVWLNSDNDALTYNSVLAAVTPMPGFQSESPFDHQELAQAINKLVSDAKITTNRVAIALPENHIFTKVIDMPVLSEKELSSAIYWEAEEHIPAPMETMTLDWTILKRPKEVVTEQKMQVLLVAAPKQLIKKYQNVLELAGLNIDSVETETLSIIRGIGKSYNSSTVILMNFGLMNTSLSIVQEGIIVFNYSIPLGGVAITRAISSDFGLSTQQAEEYKKTYGLSDKNLEGKVAEAIEPIFTNIVSEVKKAVAFYTEKYKGEIQISQILLTGGTANLPEIDSYFVKRVGIETVIVNPWKSLNINGVPVDLEPIAPEYVVACGLAIKQYEQ